MNASQINSSVQYVGASISMTLLIISFIMNMLLTIVFLKGRHSFKEQRTFAIITSQILICGYCNLCVTIFIAIPISLSGVNFYPQSVMHIILNFDTIAFNGALLFAFLLTLDRALLFLIPKIHEKVFQTKKLYICISISWLIVFGYLLYLNFAGCVKEFQFFVVRICNPQLINYWSVVVNANTYCALILPLVMLFLYIVIYAYIKFHNVKLFKASVGLSSQPAFKKRELSILFQSAIICTIFEVQTIVFHYFPQINTGNDQLQFLLASTQTWVNILLHMSQACIIFIFNRTAKEELRKLLRINVNPIPYGAASSPNIIVRQYRT